MAKSLIINQINGKNSFITVPTGATEAEAFATEFLDGAYGVYGLDSTTSASDVFTTLDEVNIMFKNKTTGLKSYLTALVEPTKTDEAIFAGLMGLTLNGVLIDEAYVLRRATAKRI